ncbi:plasmid mobilization protein [Altererythrobacter sp. H2]
MQASRISFRASPSIEAALALRAQRAGCSVSEYLRSMVREKVGLQ